jgi:hypothetical protein
MPIHSSRRIPFFIVAFKDKENSLSDEILEVKKKKKAILRGTA